MFGLWVSHNDWDRILYGIPEEHTHNVRSYLSSRHYRVVGMLHVVKRYRIGRPEGLKGTLSENQSLLVGRRFISICRARKRMRKLMGVTLVLLIAAAILAAFFMELPS